MKLKSKEANKLIFVHSILPFFIVGSVILGISIAMPFIVKPIPIIFSWLSMIAGISMFIIVLIVFPFKTEVIFDKMTGKLTIKQIKVNSAQETNIDLDDIESISINEMYKNSGRNRNNSDDVARSSRGTKGYKTYRIEAITKHGIFPLVSTYINDKKLIDKSFNEINDFLALNR